jgi:hypothetical protein
MQIKLSDVTLVYINLEADTDRRASMDAIASRWIFKDVIRLEATYNPDNFIDACTDSHIRALELAQQIDGPVLIMEDDCVELSPALDTLEIPDDTDAFYLGHYSLGLGQIRGSMLEWSTSPMAYVTEPVSDDIYRVVSMLGAHAVLYVNKDYAKFAERVCRRALELSIPQDVLIAVAMTFYNIYTCNVPLFAQASSLGWSTSFIVE